ncbi:hypothetical protein FN846DRAFT_361209 [Sphaerosporella brunnea]|uniref:Uncharacterized protein n=1 Tax=Sphaerosporella brunnea TaxID=1250544 RepID=A0A5J5F5P5_9PEZI|nr:hypothetical protein FN846DRAFT_361209 [Sphaerosporella brunnea]
MDGGARGYEESFRPTFRSDDARCGDAGRGLGLPSGRLPPRRLFRTAVRRRLQERRASGSTQGARSGKPSNYDGITRGDPDAARTPAPTRNDDGGNAGSSTCCGKVETRTPHQAPRAPPQQSLSRPLPSGQSIQTPDELTARAIIRRGPEATPRRRASIVTLARLGIGFRKIEEMTGVKKSTANEVFPNAVKNATDRRASLTGSSALDASSAMSEPEERLRNAEDIWIPINFGLALRTAYRG